MTRLLDVYLHDKLAGQLRQETSGELRFQYDAHYQQMPGAVAISISLPLHQDLHEGAPVRAFFSGLLPEEIVRHRLARYLGLSEQNAFGLLEAIGGECAGALSVYPEGQKPPPPTPQDLTKLDDAQLGEILDLLKRRPLLAGSDHVRLSLAGAQDKIAVSLVDDTVALVQGTTPTSHILKPMIETVADSVPNELFCSQLATRVGIEVPKTEMRWIGSTPYFLIERYDRVYQPDKGLIRLHQEDFCQALGILPELKYEREGGPSVEACLMLLQKHVRHPAPDRLKFVRRLVFNYLIGNADAHGKNFSLLYHDTVPQLAPAYDLLSTAVYPMVSQKMAMKIGGHYDPEMLVLRHWHRLVPDTAAAKKVFNADLKHMAQTCQQQAAGLIKDLAQQGLRSNIFDEINQVIQHRSQILLSLV